MVYVSAAVAVRKDTAKTMQKCEEVSDFSRPSCASCLLDSLCISPSYLAPTC